MFETSFFRLFFIFRDIFVFKSGMDNFSRLAHSIELFKSYKTVYFPNSKNIGHIRNSQAHYVRDIISCFFYWYSADFCQNTVIWVKTNIIFGISIKNWVELCLFQIFSRALFFAEKFTRGPPQGWVKKWSHS